jgi:ribosomal protein S12 methylthiotransferase accessory factor
MNALKNVIEAYRAALPPGHFELFREDAIDRIGIPVVAASLRLSDGTQLGTHGYGMTEEEATVSALGEMAEFVFAELALRNLLRIEGSRQALVERHGVDGVADPLELGLPAGSPYRPDMPLTWIAATRLATGARVLVPEAWVAVSPGQLHGRTEPLITPITNGQGAGLTREQAVAHGLAELLQRDGNGLNFRALDQGMALDFGPADLDEDCRRLMAHYRTCGIEPVPKLASTEFGMVNLYVVGRDSDPGNQPLVITACGEAADPDRSRALRKALLEYAASRARKAFSNGPLDAVRRVAPLGYLDRYLAGLNLDKEEARALRAMAVWAGLDAAALRALVADSVLKVTGSVPFRELPVEPDAADPAFRSGLMAGHLTKAGFDVLTVDMTPPDSPVQVVKVIVPGLEVETMSYHRIGQRGVQKLLARREPLVGLGQSPDGAKPVRLTQEAEDWLGGPVWFDSARADRIVAQLYPLYREPERHAAQYALETGYFAENDAARA